MADAGRPLRLKRNPGVKRQAYEPQNTGATSTSPVVLALVRSYDNRRDADDSQAAEEAVWTAPCGVDGRAGTCRCHVLVSSEKARRQTAP
jgi:hypothetical protein